MEETTTLQAVWFLLISIMWLGYFVLEGYDFGVGMLLRYVGRSDAERRAVIHSIGPFWDGNEVWLIVAGAATFAAFPQWYATLFSGFYLALFLILLALIVRGVAFEFWGKREDRRWRSGWEWALVLGSGLPALLWGVGWADIVHGVPINESGDYTGTLFDLLGPYALLGGLATLTLFGAHGAIFLALRTKGVLEERARSIAVRATPLAAAVCIAFLVWTLIDQGGGNGVEAGSAACAGAAAVLLVASAALVRRSPGWAFAATSGAIVFLFTALFVDLFPNAMVSSTNEAFDLTLADAASSNYTLKVMTVVAVTLVPFVLVYQAWSHWVFRHRLGAEDFAEVRTPADLIARHGTESGEQA